MLSNKEININVKISQKGNHANAPIVAMDNEDMKMNIDEDEKITKYYCNTTFFGTLFKLAYS